MGLTLDDIAKINRSTEEKVRRARLDGAALIPPAPYYGYVAVNAFDCPSFILFTNDDAPVVSYILMEGTFEQTSMKLWCNLSRSASGIADIGANVGIYALAAALLRPELDIHAFEPNPYAFARLRMHKEINGAHNIREHIVAVGSKNAVVQFSWVVKPGGNIASGAGIGARAKANTEETVVRMISLDGTGVAQTLGARPLMKIDVEGGEALAFRGMSEVLALKPDIILETFDAKASGEIWSMLSPLGYSVYHILEQENRLVPRERLMPTRIQGHDFNQFLTVHPLPEL